MPPVAAKECIAGMGGGMAAPDLWTVVVVVWVVVCIGGAMA